MLKNENEAIQAIVYNNVNVTEKNPLKDLFQVVVQLFIWVVIIYFSVFAISGVVLKNISLQQQIELEKFLSRDLKEETIKLTPEEQARLLKARNLVLKTDSKFPKTSNLKIEVIEADEKNALCLPNGNIYITDKFYKTLDSEDKLVFVLAHEMAHYKNRDHLMGLRKSISSNMVIISLYLFGGNMNDTSKLISSSIDLVDMKYSKLEETKADIYAGKILLNLYGTTKAGVEVMNILKEGDYDLGFEFMSTHPLHETRVKCLKNLKSKKI